MLIISFRKRVSIRLTLTKLSSSPFYHLRIDAQEHPTIVNPCVTDA